MREINDEELKKIEIDILDCIVKFCDENNLTYFLAFGTLIGAVRHKGFIPWDDDVDIQMPRADYDYLISNFNGLSKDYKLISPYDKSSLYTYVKIVDVRTQKIEQGVVYTDTKFGIDVDVFPIEGQPDNTKVYNKWYKKLMRNYRKCIISILDKKQGRFLRRACLAILKPFIHNRLKYFEKANKLHSRYPYETSKYVGTVSSLYDDIGNRAEKECFDDFVSVEFEGKTYKVPKGFDTVLRNIYGDYMQLPPIEQQQTHHRFKAYYID